MEPEPIENAPVQNNNEEQPLPPPSNPENQPQNAIAQPPLGASRNLTSDVWPHFTRLYLNGILKAKCIYYKKVLAGKSTNGTSHLRTHRNRCVQKKIHDGSQRILGANYSAKGKAEMSTNQFSSEVSRKELCIMIVVHEYPLSIVDHLYFKRFCCSLNPLFKGFEKSKMQKIIDQNKGRIAITTDMWTASNQKRGYMAVTSHYIDNGWKLRNHLVMFGYLPAPHTSQRLAVRLS
ncbi:Putative AC transposase [Linum grandiflorum]